MRRRRRRQERSSSITGQGTVTQAQAGAQEHSQSNAKALGAALRINTRAGVTCPHLPDCKRGEDSAGTLEKLFFWHRTVAV